jgi:hypothetical protein
VVALGVSGGHALALLVAICCLMVKKLKKLVVKKLMVMVKSDWGVSKDGI